MPRVPRHERPKARRPAAVPRSYQANHVVGVNLVLIRNPFTKIREYWFAGWLFIRGVDEGIGFWNDASNENKIDGVHNYMSPSSTHAYGPVPFIKTCTPHMKKQLFNKNTLTQPFMQHILIVVDVEAFTARTFFTKAVRPPNVALT